MSIKKTDPCVSVETRSPVVQGGSDINITDWNNFIFFHRIDLYANNKDLFAEKWNVFYFLGIYIWIFLGTSFSTPKMFRKLSHRPQVSSKGESTTEADFVTLLKEKKGRIFWQWKSRKTQFFAMRKSTSECNQINITQ